ncbi:MAG: zinc-ribbon and DUF3426 domain-containing protein [Candidatus Protistobacter heckmanni]|nr:zinc-ribbon and DUF3426 domain-containing protein [Candidatus Protistobacter heckmanni]
MLLTTCCPYCKTGFRIAPDQLKQRQGLVRCGRCMPVFNGADNQIRTTVVEPDAIMAAAIRVAAMQADQAAPAPQAEPEVLREMVELAEPAGAQAQAGTQIDAHAEAQAAADAPSAAALGAQFDTKFAALNDALDEELTPPAQEADRAQPSAPAQEELTAALEGLQLDREPEPDAQAASAEEKTADYVDVVFESKPNPPFPSGARDAATDAIVTEGLLLDGDGGASPLPARVPQPSLYGDDEDLQPSFIRERRRSAGAGLRWALSLILFVALAAQLAYTGRNVVASTVPAAAPLLQTACAELGCELAPVRNPDAWAIQNSDLQQVGGAGQIYLLSANLKQSAGYTLALPALELTLTDVQGKPTASRVLMPKEYLPEEQEALAASGLAPGAEVALALPLELRAAAVNYRLLAFYP